MEIYNCFKMKSVWENYLNLLEGVYSDVGPFPYSENICYSVYINLAHYGQVMSVRGAIYVWTTLP